jgi:hypothetical protein
MGLLGRPVELALVLHPQMRVGGTNVQVDEYQGHCGPHYDGLWPCSGGARIEAGHGLSLGSPEQGPEAGVPLIVVVRAGSAVDR